LPDDRQPPGLARDAAEAILHALAGPADRPANGSASDGPPTPTLDHPHAAPSRSPAPVPAPAPLAADSFHGLLEAVPDALVLVDHAGRIVLVNGHAEQMFGYRREELIGQLIEVLVPDRIRDTHVAQRDTYFASPRVRPLGVGMDLVGRRKDGHEVPVEISLSPMPAAGGPLVVASVRDVSTRRKAEAQLRKVEQRYRTLVEGIPAVTFMAAMDEGANELYVSPQIEELLGFSQQEWVENPILWFTQLHPEDRTRWHEEFAVTVATGDPFRSVYRFIARDGRVVWVHGEAQVIRDEEGRPLFLQGVAFDITGIKQAEINLKALNTTLERRVAERTAEVEGRSRELARSNQALDQFGYVAAHDLREPLRTMKSYVQKLAKEYEDRLDSVAEGYVTRTVNAAVRMEALIRDLLAYSRVRTEGKEPSAVECGETLVNALANLHAAVEESGATVTADELPVVRADPTQLAQLLQNLVGNALKFRAAGRSPAIHVAAVRRGAEWEIGVRDNGIGIEPTALERIFKLGIESRLHSRSEYPGSGIGLATCEKIVQRHGGRIWATSAGPGTGTTLWFTLPAAD
jgi:PAS domain S-box-containing protein